MNNEPVAWLLFCDGGESYPQYTKSYKEMREWETYLGDNQRIEPLYTHPVKELTDEEIQEIWEGLFENEDDIVHIHNFARAIEAKVRGEK